MTRLTLASATKPRRSATPKVRKAIANARIALAAYQEIRGVEPIEQSGSFVQLLSDLLTDLRHAAHAFDIDAFADAARTSQMHFEAESRSEP